MNYRPESKVLTVDYPACLGRHIGRLPMYCRSQAWFDALPEPIRRQFVTTLQNFPLAVAAEYLADNHGTDAAKVIGNKSERADYLRLSEVTVAGLWYSHGVVFETPYGQINRSATKHTPSWDYLAIAVRFIVVDGVREKQVLSVASKFRRHATSGLRKKAGDRGWNFAQTDLLLYRCTIERADSIPQALGEVLN